MESKVSNKSGSKTGTSTGAYVEVFRVDTRGCGNQGLTMVLIKNTGASWDLKYKITGYPYDVDGTQGGLGYAEAAETTLAEATQAIEDVSAGYAALVVSVMSGESTATTWQIDYTTY